MINLADIQWWQTVGIVLGALGLSPAPWIIGLGYGRLQFTKVAEANFVKRETAVNKYHEDVVTQMKINHASELANLRERLDESKVTSLKFEAAGEREKERADKATDALAAFVEAVQSTNHAIKSFTEVASEVAGSAPT